jgi:Rhodanese-related sulfurtransferase
MKTIYMTMIAAMLSIFGCSVGDGSFKSIGVDEFAKTISDTTVTRLDVRTPSEYAVGHIEGSVNIDVLQESFESIALDKLPKDRTVALYCRSGNRSKTAARILTKDGFKVVELAVGYNGWTAAGKPVTQ